MQTKTDDILHQLGERVLAARKARGWPRHKLCERSGISPRYLAQLESGQGNISVSLLSKVAAALDTALHDLLSPTTDPLTQNYRAATPDIRAQVDQLLRPAKQTHDRICLIGLRGAGKSTLGSKLAASLQIPFVELSKEITDHAGLPINEVMALYGVDGFRDLEAQALDRVIAKHQRVVLAVAGGIVSDADIYAKLLTNFRSIWLRASPAEHMARVKEQGDMRPMKGNPQAMDQLKAILAKREPDYAQADAQLDTSGLSVQQSLEALMSLANVGAAPQQNNLR